MANSVVLSSLGHTWLIDIDGTILKHNGYIMDGEDTLLDGVEEFFKQIPDSDVVIFLTSRKKEFKEMTEQFLHSHNIRYDLIVFGLPYGERIVVNDEKPSGLKMSKAIDLQRDAFDVNFIIDEGI